MPARSRRSVTNTISAAILEITIMGLFVILAQPQLRDALFEILHPNDPAAVPAVTTHTLARPVVGTLTSSARNLNGDRVGQSSLPSTSANNYPSLPALMQLPSTANQNETVDFGAGQRTAGYAPLEQYESFSVSVPSVGQSQVNDYTRQPPSQLASPGWSPTQLLPNQWNIASASQSPRTLTPGGSMPAPPIETSYRDIYPPPYGTQSMWK